jgi:hypothetical protein
MSESKKVYRINSKQYKEMWHAGDEPLEPEGSRRST